MGEIAEMMLDGTLCSCCGAFMEENFDLSSPITATLPPGIPMMCAGCADDERRERERNAKGDRKKRRLRDKRKPQQKRLAKERG